jgi:hypothetical protein
MAVSVRELPFYGADGTYRLSVPVELDANGLPPSEVELLGPDETGQLMRWRYELGRRPPHPSGAWVYLEASRRPYEGVATWVEDVPARSGLDAIRRLLATEDWPFDYLD